MSSDVPVASKRTHGNPRALTRSETRRLPARVSVYDQLGTGDEGLGGHGIHVADDHRGLQAELQECIRASVDTDEHRIELADVRPQRPKVFSIVVSAHDDKDMSALKDVRVLRKTGGLQ